MDLFGADEATLQREGMDRMMAGLNTCLPGIIQSFDDTTQTAVVIPAIQMKITIQEVVSYTNLPVIVNVPIVFPFAIGNGFALTLPIKAGDSCLLVFSQRAIDNWHDQGGVQPPEQNAIGCRHHSLTDAFAIMAPAAIPDVLGAWNSAGIELRSRARDVRVTVEADKAVVKAGDTTLTLLTSGAVTLSAATSVSVTSPTVSITGNLEVTGTIKDGVRKMSEDRGIYNSHTHSGIGVIPTQQE